LHRSSGAPPIAVGGEGIYLYGTRVTDGSGVAAAAGIGHANQRVTFAVGRQTAAMVYARTGTFSSQPVEGPAHILLDGETGGLTQAYFCSEGTEAALKLAHQYFVELGQPQRTRFIAWAKGLARLRAALIERFGHHRYVGDIRGRGLFWALEFVGDRATKQVFDPKLAMNERVKLQAPSHGSAIYPMGGTIDGRQGNHLFVAPPSIAAASDIDAIFERLGGGAAEAAVASAT